GGLSEARHPLAGQRRHRCGDPRLEVLEGRYTGGDHPGAARDASLRTARDGPGAYPAVRPPPAGTSVVGPISKKTAPHEDDRPTVCTRDSPGAGPGVGSAMAERDPQEG